MVGVCIFMFSFWNDVAFFFSLVRFGVEEDCQLTMSSFPVDTVMVRSDFHMKATVISMERFKCVIMLFILFALVRFLSQ